MPYKSHKKTMPSAQTHDNLQLSTIDAQIARAKLLLTRALKLAKAFERQKLGRRQRAAILSETPQVCNRILAEIDALKVGALGRLKDGEINFTYNQVTKDIHPTH